MKGDFEINVPGVKRAGEEYREMSRILTDCVKRLEAIRKDLPQHSYGDIKNVLASLEGKQREHIKGIKAMEW